MKILETFDNKCYEIDEKIVDQIMNDSSEDKKNGIWIGSDYIAFASIKSISDLSEAKNFYPDLPAVGFTGVINKTNRLSALEAMARGLKKAKAKLEKEGRTTKNIDSLLELARKRYAKVKLQV